MPDASLSTFLARYTSTILVEIEAVKGSSPREAGTFMLVSQKAIWETIGGGQFEYMAIDHARAMLRSGVAEDRMDIPLGPEIGQCCGGRVEVGLFVVDEAKAAELASRAEAEDASRSHIFIFGAGNVGHALALALSPLPVKVRVIDTRPEALEGLPVNVSGVATALPEAQVRSAPQGTSYVILTHDHALDFLIAGEALRREDAPYVGMVGSRNGWAEAPYAPCPASPKSLADAVLAVSERISIVPGVIGPEFSIQCSVVAWAPPPTIES